MINYKLLVNLFILFISSCGIRVKEDKLNNLFPGRWTVNEINCLRFGTLTEKYEVSSNNIDAVFFFENKTFLLEVSGCGLNQGGSYITNYQAQDRGTTAFINLDNGNSCNYDILDTVGGGGQVSVSFDLLESLSQELSFNFSSNALSLGSGTNFKGSAVVGSCAGECECYFDMTTN